MSGSTSGSNSTKAGTGAGIVTASGNVEYAWWQTDATWKFLRGFYLELDGRLARYEKPSWQLEGTFASGYAEVGYKGRYFLINLGYGFDPVVFDPVINDFTHIGRTEELRKSLTEGVRRSNAASIGAKLLEQEAVLEGNHTIKLETIIRF